MDPLKEPYTILHITDLLSLLGLQAGQGLNCIEKFGLPGKLPVCIAGKDL